MQFDLFGGEVTVIDHPATGLLKAVNSGENKKKKDRFRLVHSVELVKDRFLITAQDDTNTTIYNIVDGEGNVPPNYCINWRYAYLALQDVNEELTKNEP